MCTPHCGASAQTRAYVVDVDLSTSDLSAQNPNAPEEAPLREPEDIIAEIISLDAETVVHLNRVRELISK